MLNARTILVALVLAAMAAPPALARDGEGPAEPRGKIRLILRNTGEDPDARGKVLFAWARHAEQARFALRVRNLDVGAYEVLVDGVPEGRIEVRPAPVGPGTVGGLRLGTAAGDLGFDPRGKSIAVVQNGVAYLAGIMPRHGHPGRGARFGTRLENVSESQPEARARAHYASRSGRARFLVIVRGAEPGSYDLSVDGELVGRIEVGPRGNGLAKFDTVPHRPGSGWQLLTFRVLGRPIEVSQGSELMFTGRLPDTP